MKQKNNTSYFYTFIILVLVATAIGIGLMNILYWESIVPNLLFNSEIENNLGSFWATLWILGIAYLFKDSCENSGKAYRYLWLLPITMIMTKALMYMGLSITANGKTWWVGLTLDGYNYYSISYFTLMIVAMIVAVPKGINYFVKKGYEYERLKISLYGAIISLGSILMFREMKAAVICGFFILFYYVLKSKKKGKALVFLPYIVVVLFGAFYGVNDHLSTFYVKETFSRFIYLRDNSLFSLNGNTLWLLKDYSSWAGLIAILTIYVLIIVLLAVYIRKFISSKEKRLNAVYLWATLVVFWLCAILGNLVIDFNLSFGAPFLTKNSFIWIIFIYQIISLKGMDWEESLNRDVEEYFIDYEFQKVELQETKDRIHYMTNLDNGTDIHITVKLYEHSYMDTRIMFNSEFNEIKELDVYKLLNKYNRSQSYRCVITESNKIVLTKLDLIDVPERFDIFEWYTEFDIAFATCEKLCKEIKELK